MTTVSLCSYTYNDGELLHGLLAGVPAWTARPDEIVLVDDGSGEPFSLREGETHGIPARLIRLPENKGFTTAKHTGLSAAQGDILFSMDCDSRVDPDFMRRCVAWLRKPEIGLVSGSSGLNEGTDVMSLYFNLFGISIVTETGPVDFIPGGAFALRRELWESIGGFSDYPDRRGQDHYLCRRIKDTGLQLFVDSGIHVLNARRLTRDVYCRRAWAWCGRAWLGHARPNIPLPAFFAHYFVKPLLMRCSIILNEDHPMEFLYVELLLVSYFAFALCNALGKEGRIPLESHAALRRELNEYLSPYPALRRLLKADLLRSEALPAQAGTAPDPSDSSPLATDCDWRAALEFLEFFREERALEWLDKHGVRRMLEDEAALRTDFSTY